MDPLAEFTKLECWDENGKPYLKEVSPDTPCSTIASVVVSGSTAHILAVRRFGEDEGEDRDNYWRWVLLPFVRMEMTDSGQATPG